MIRMDKSLLQQYAQTNGWNVPDYRAMKVEGPPHRPLFKSVVTINEGHYTSTEMWSSIKDAEQAAARAAIKSLNLDYVPAAGVHKSILQQHCQKQKLDLPVYRVETVPTGFRATVEIAGRSFVGPPAPKKREAQAKAAEAALEDLGWLNPAPPTTLTAPRAPLPLKRSAEDVLGTGPPEKQQKIEAKAEETEEGVAVGSPVEL